MTTIVRRRVQSV